ncbi:MAG: VanZ family protein [Arachidicoccus sp.]|nr:VanZ family protein [Arachidicoccus sp.]
MNTKQIISIIYFLLLFYIVFGIRIYPKMNIDGFHTHYGFNLQLFERYRNVHTLKQLMKIISNIDWYFNVLMFVPFPYCFQQLFCVRNLYAIFAAGLISSVCIEIIQYIFKIGMADIHDIMTNTIGVAIGTGILKLIAGISKNM